MEIACRSAEYEFKVALDVASRLKPRDENDNGDSVVLVDSTAVVPS